jgi:hypothetical protein
LIRAVFFDVSIEEKTLKSGIVTSWTGHVVHRKEDRLAFTTFNWKFRDSKTSKKSEEHMKNAVERGRTASGSKNWEKHTNSKNSRLYFK